MEWLVVVVVGVVLLGWWGARRGTTGGAPPVMLARTTAVPAAGGGAVAAMATSPLAGEVARRALDPDDPDGAFMDGYVAGRYSERAENGLPPGAGVDRGARLDDDLEDDLTDSDDPDADLGSTGAGCDTADLYRATAWHDTSDGALHDDFADDW